MKDISLHIYKSVRLLLSVLGGSFGTQVGGASAFAWEENAMGLAGTDHIGPPTHYSI